MERFQFFSVLFLLTLFSLVVIPGYGVFIHDHEVHIPQINQVLEPSLYASDFSLSFQQSSYTYFDEVISFLLQILPLDFFALFLLLTVLFRFLAIYAIYALAKYFTKDLSFSLLAPLLFFFPQPIFGASIGIFEHALYPRFISLTFSLLFLILFFRERYVSGSLFLGLAVLAHPLAALPFLLFLFISRLVALCKRATSLSSFSTSLVLPVFAGLFLMLATSTSQLSLFSRMDSVWKAILQARTPYLYLIQWHYSIFLVLIAYIVLFVILFFSLPKLLNKKTQRFHLSLLLLIPFSLAFFSFLAVDLFGFHFFAQLQLGRSLLLLRLFLLLFFGYFVYRLIASYRSDLLYLFSAIGIVLALVIEEFFVLLFLPLFLVLWIRKQYPSFTSLQRSSVLFLLFILYTVVFVFLLFLTESMTLLSYFVLLFFLTFFLTWFFSSFSFYKKWSLSKVLLIALPLLVLVFTPQFSFHPTYFADDSFMETCAWIKEQTSQDALFLVEPFSAKGAPLRMTCFRSVFATRKEGAQSAFEREYALEWDERITYLDAVASDIALLPSLAEEYSIDYVLSETPLEVPYTLAYSNERYYLYDLHKL